MKTIREYLLVTGISVFGIILAAVILEGGFRLLGPGRAPAGSAWNDRPTYYVAPEGSRTLRDFPYPREKKRGNFRVSVVGDSFTYGPYIQFNDTFPKRLEQLFNLNQIEERMEVINYGIPAYSSHHEIALVDQVLTEDPDLIILQITLNDPELKPYRPTGLTGFADRFGALRPSPWQQLLFRYSKAAEFVAGRLHNAQTHTAYRDYYLDLFENPRTWRGFEESIRKIVSHTRRAGRRIGAVVFPLFGTPLDASYPLEPAHHKIAALLDELKVRHLDLLGAYRGIPYERLQVIPGVDRHPNEIGHRIAAERMYAWMLGQRMVPKKFAAKQVYAERIGISDLKPLTFEDVTKEFAATAQEENSLRFKM